jgi:hypothetical protein
MVDWCCLVFFCVVASVAGDFTAKLAPRVIVDLGESSRVDATPWNVTLAARTPQSLPSGCSASSGVFECSVVTTSNKFRTSSLLFSSFGFAVAPDDVLDTIRVELTRSSTEATEDERLEIVLGNTVLSDNIRSSVPWPRVATTVIYEIDDDDEYMFPVRGNVVNNASFGFRLVVRSDGGPNRRGLASIVCASVAVQMRSLPATTTRATTRLATTAATTRTGAAASTTTTTTGNATALVSPPSASESDADSSGVVAAAVLVPLAVLCVAGAVGVVIYRRRVASANADAETAAETAAESTSTGTIDPAQPARKQYGAIPGRQIDFAASALPLPDLEVPHAGFNNEFV